MAGTPFISMGQDLRFALRQLRRSPGFTATAVLTLGLAVGATVTMAGIAKSTLLSPLPYAEPDRLVGVAFAYPTAEPNDSQIGNAADFIAEHAKSFAATGVATDAAGGVNLWVGEGAGGRAIQVMSRKVSRGYLPTLDLQPTLGANFTAEQDRPGGPRTVLISDRLWRSAFHSDPGVVNRTVRLNGDSYIVAGVMPASYADNGYSAPNERASVDLWMPLQLGPKDPGYEGNNYEMIARLKQGVSLAAASEELHTLEVPFYQQYPGYRQWVSMKGDKQLHQFRLWPLRDVEISNVRPAILMLTGAVGAVLLVACLNLAGLMTARGLRRARELAVRVSLGASPTRLLRLLLCESALVALAGAALGVLLSRLMTPALIAASPIALPSIGHAGGALLTTVSLLLVLVTMFFGLLPAVRVLRVGSAEVLRSGQAGGVTQDRARLERALIVAQVAVATILLTASSLLLSSFLRLRSIDSGVRAEHLAIAQVTLKGDGYESAAATTQFVQKVVERLRTEPGVTSVAAVNGLPLDRGLNMSLGPADDPNGKKYGELRLVSPGYFQTMGIPVMMGRDLGEGDSAGAARVVIISQAAAKKWWPGRSPLGLQVNMGGRDRDVRTVVGVVGDVHSHSLAENALPIVYEPFAQAGDGMTKIVNGWFPTTFAVRMAGQQDVARMMEQAVAAADPTIPLAKVKTMQSVIDHTVEAPRFFSWMAGGFAGFSLLLTAIGLFGLLSYQVSTRLREIGVRLAVGATRSQVLRLFLSRGVALTITGLIVGAALSMLLPRLIGGMLADFTWTDNTAPGFLLSNTVAALAKAALGMVGVALLASLLPARRASQVEPSTILRAE